MRWKHTYVAILLVLSLNIFIIFDSWLSVNDVDCDARDFLTSQTPKLQIHATKVVVEPWLGEHHVYGIFIVPDRYKETPFFILTVKGVGSACEKPFGTLENIDGIFAMPGTHIIRDYIRTRTAIRLIVKGLYNQLNDKYNWTLTYPIISKY